MKNHTLLYILCLSLASGLLAQEDAQDDAQVHELLEKKLPDKSSKKNKKRGKKQTVLFNFDYTDLVDIINLIAAEKGINIILPMGSAPKEKTPEGKEVPAGINVKVTLRMENPVPLEQAWAMLHTLLDIAGYSLIQKHDTYVVVRNSKEITREPVPIFIGVDPAQLPDYEKRIIYIYYLTHLKVPKVNEPNELDGILKAILPAESPTQPALIKYDPASNAVILQDNANNIKGAMMVVKELDKPGYQESFEMVRLRHTQAETIANLLNNFVIGSTNPQIRFNYRPSEAHYFSQGTRIISEPRTNSLFILGTDQAIERVKEFIFKYLDVELGSGKSILHTYQLQYLDAVDFAKVLDRIVKAEGAQVEGGAPQSTAKAERGSTERFFEGVAIMTDRPAGLKEVAEKPEKSVYKYYGGNKLIVAARSEDWERLRKIIEELDTPQPQVILEVLIADLTITDDRILGSIMRNPAAIPMPRIGYSNRPMSFQSAQLGQVATNNVNCSVAPPLGPSVAGPNSSLAANLAKFDTINLTNGSCVPGVDIAAAISALRPGSTMITISDPLNTAPPGAPGSTWDILQILESYAQVKVLSHPHIIATNNKNAQVAATEVRLVAAEAVGSAGGATTVRNANITATLTVNLTPHISSANTVNIQISIDIQEFTTMDTTNANRNTRNLTTNANVESNAILALGGLLRTSTTANQVETPLLARIPILGWLFKSREEVSTKNNLTVFIRPIIIQPRLRGGVDGYTKDHIGIAKTYSREGVVFDNLRDPITRWFFGKADDAEEATNLFLEQNVEPVKLFDQPVRPLTKKERRERKKLAKNEPIKEKAAEVLTADRSEQMKKLLEEQENPLIATEHRTRETILNT